MANVTTTAEKVQAGDMIPGLGNAYVFDVEEDADFRDRNNIGLGRGKVCLTCHDQNGDEMYLLLTPDTEVAVTR